MSREIIQEKNGVKTYMDWPLYDNMPTGYKIDKTAGSPLFGYSFITNGPPISGGKRALLRVIRPENEISAIAPEKPMQQTGLSSDRQESLKPQKIQFDSLHAKTVNDLARAKFKEKLLNDILVDLTICRIEGWSKMEYINELKKLIDSLAPITSSQKT